MPNIKTYDTPALGLVPSETGIQAVAAAARRGGAFFNQAAGAISQVGHEVGSAIREAGDVAVKYIDHQQISKGAADGAEFIDNLDRSWEQKAKSDPGNPTNAAQWREEVLEPALDKFKSGFTTERSQQWAENFTEKYRSHMFLKTSADTASNQADAVKINTLKTINSLGNVVGNDPSSLEFSRDTLRSTVSGLVDSSPNMSAAQSATVRNDLMFKGEEHLVKAAVMGAITKGGDWEKIARDPKNSPFINVSEMQTFERAAKAQQKSDTLQQKQIDVYQRQQAEHAAEVQSNKIFADNVTFDETTGRAIIKPEFFKQAIDLAKQFPNAPGAATKARSYINWGEAQQKPLAESKMVSDPLALRDVTDRMFDPDNPTSRIDVLRLQSEGKLSPRDAAAKLKLVTELEKAPIRGQVWRDTMNAVKSRLMPPLSALLGPDPKGVQDYAAFVQSFVPQYIQASKSPTGAPPGALDLKNPNSMISQALAPFEGHNTFQERFRGQPPEWSTPGPAQEERKRAIERGDVKLTPTSQPEKPKVPQRLPNETWDAYKKRTGL